MRTLLGTTGNVLIREVSLIQGLINTLSYHVGTKQSVLNIRDVLVSGSPHLGVSLYIHIIYSDTQPIS